MVVLLNVRGFPVGAAAAASAKMDCFPTPSTWTRTPTTQQRSINGGGDGNDDDDHHGKGAGARVVRGRRKGHRATRQDRVEEAQARGGGVRDGRRAQDILLPAAASHLLPFSDVVFPCSSWSGRGRRARQVRLRTASLVVVVGVLCCVGVRGFRRLRRRQVVAVTVLDDDAASALPFAAQEQQQGAGGLPTGSLRGLERRRVGTAPLREWTARAFSAFVFRILLVHVTVAPPEKSYDAPRCADATFGPALIEALRQIRRRPLRRHGYPRRAGGRRRRRGAGGGNEDNGVEDEEEEEDEALYDDDDDDDDEDEDDEDKIPAPREDLSLCWLGAGEQPPQPLLVLVRRTTTCSCTRPMAPTPREERRTRRTFRRTQLRARVSGARPRFTPAGSSVIGEVLLVLLVVVQRRGGAAVAVSASVLHRWAAAAAATPRLR